MIQFSEKQNNKLFQVKGLNKKIKKLINLYKIKNYRLLNL